jgi:hypothetical protein
MVWLVMFCIPTRPDVFSMRKKIVLILYQSSAFVLSITATSWNQSGHVASGFSILIAALSQWCDKSLHISPYYITNNNSLEPEPESLNRPVVLGEAGRHCLP